MNSLRFDRSGIEMRQAAIVLAISQDEWASYVRCNPMDYRTLGWHWCNYPDFKISIQKDEFGSFQQLMEQTQDAFAQNVHYIIIRPDPDVPEGWVMLPDPPPRQCKTCAECEKCRTCGYCYCTSPKI